MMRSVLLLTAVTLGLGGANVALADAPDKASHELVMTDSSSVENANVELTPVQDERVTVQRTRSNAPLRGDVAWVVAGAAGALVPLALFAVPALFLGLFGPFAPLAFLGGIAVAALTTGLGGAVAWAIEALLSDMRSGFLMPILGSAAVGLGVTFLAGSLATLIIAGGVGLAWLVGGARDIFEVIRPDNLVNIFNRREGPIVGAATTLGALTWAVGVIGASIAGPLVGAYLYRANGEPKYVEEAVSVESRNLDNEFDDEYVVPDTDDTVVQ